MSSRPVLGRFAIACGLALAGAACGGRPQIGALPGAVVVQQSEMPAPGAQGSAPLVERQEIAPFDKLLIDVFGIEALQKREVTVDAAGNLGFPLVGTVQAVGLTPDELAATLRDAMKRNYIRDPQVAVSVVQSNGAGTFTVEGSVNQPGIYPITERMTLLKAVAVARGTNEDAKTNTVLVFRTVGTTEYVGAYDLVAIRRGNYADPIIYPRDKVVIDESRSGRLLRNIGPLIAAPLIAVLNQL